MTRRFLILPIGLLFTAVGALLLVTFGGNPGNESVREGAEIRRASASIARRDRQKTKALLVGSVPGEVEAAPREGRTPTAAPSTHPEEAGSLEDFFDGVPVGDPTEWVLSRATMGVADPPREIANIIFETVDSPWMDEPPYDVRHVLGASDLPWLRRFAAAYHREYEEIAKLPSEDVRSELRKDLQVRGRQVLTTLAASRVQAHDALSAQFDDGRLLVDLPEDGAEAAWLSRMLSLNWPGLLFMYIDILPTAYRKLVSARDLPYLRKMSAASYQIVDHTKDERGQHTKETERQLRDLARELAAYLRSRARN